MVSLRVAGGTVQLDIADNGRGIKPESVEDTQSGDGRDAGRARQLRGELIVENRKDGGLDIHVEVPLQQVEPDAVQEDSSFVG